MNSLNAGTMRERNWLVRGGGGGDRDKCGGNWVGTPGRREAMRDGEGRGMG